MISKELARAGFSKKVKVEPKHIARDAPHPEYGQYSALGSPQLQDHGSYRTFDFLTLAFKCHTPLLSIFFGHLKILASLVLAFLCTLWFFFLKSSWAVISTVEKLLCRCVLSQRNNTEVLVNIQLDGQGDLVPQETNLKHHYRHPAVKIEPGYTKRFQAFCVFLNISEYSQKFKNTQSMKYLNSLFWLSLFIWMGKGNNFKVRSQAFLPPTNRFDVQVSLTISILIIRDIGIPRPCSGHLTCNVLCCPHGWRALAACRLGSVATILV